MAELDELRTDLGMVVDDKGIADIAWADGEIKKVAGVANLRQALALRILVGRGELAAIGHARYGSYIPELIGEPLDRTNLELLRRFVRQAIKADPRVLEITQIVVSVRPDAPGIALVDATVKAIGEQEVKLALALDVS